MIFEFMNSSWMLSKEGKDINVPGLLQQPQLDLAEALHEEQRQAMAERAAELRMEPRHAIRTELTQLPCDWKMKKTNVERNVTYNNGPRWLFVYLLYVFVQNIQYWQSKVRGNRMSRYCKAWWEDLFTCPIPLFVQRQLRPALTLTAISFSDWELAALFAQ